LRRDARGNSGRGSQRQRSPKIVAVPCTFQQIALREPFWDVVGETLASLYARGVTVPFPDAVIATVGIANRLDVWARETLLAGLQLFQEPP
jgi:predicted nucleic acid-binding protein